MPLAIRALEVKTVKFDMLWTIETILVHIYISPHTYDS